MGAQPRLSIQGATDEILRRGQAGPTGATYGQLHAPPPTDLDQLRRQQHAFKQTREELDGRNWWMAVPALAPAAAVFGPRRRRRNRGAVRSRHSLRAACPTGPRTNGLWTRRPRRRSGIEPGKSGLGRTKLKRASSTPTFITAIRSNGPISSQTPIPIGLPTSGLSLPRSTQSLTERGAHSNER